MRKLPTCAWAFMLTATIILSGCTGGSGSQAPASAPQSAAAPSVSAPAGDSSAEGFTFEKSIEIICPWSAGGGSDTNARTIAQAVSQITGQTVTVSNQTGGSGSIGFAAQISAEPSGYTLGIVTAELNTLPPQGLVTYTYDDLHPVIRMNVVPACIAVRADAPYDTLDEFIAYAKEHPGELKCGNVGIGSIWHISAAKLEAAAGMEFVHVPYDGAAAAAPALLGGEIDLITVETAVCHQYAATGDMKILGIMAEERLFSFPDYPTCKELGYDIVSGSWHGMVAPKGVSDEVKAELERVFTEAYDSELYQSFCESYGLEKSYLNSADWHQFLKNDLESTTELMKSLGLAD